MSSSDVKKHEKTSMDSDASLETKNHETYGSVRSSSGDPVVIDIQPFLIPLSIVIAGFFIAVGLYFGLSSQESSAATNTPLVAESPTNNTPTQQAATPTQQQQAQNQLPDAVLTSIDDDPYIGNRDTAKVAIIEFSDYQCPYCRLHAQNNVAGLKEKYVDSGEAIIVYRDYVAVSSHNPVATYQGVAAECVQEYAGNEAYFEYHDEVFNQNPTTQGQLAALAEDYGLDEATFNECFNSDEMHNEFNADNAAARAAGLNGTPAFVVGRLYEDGTVEGLPFSGYAQNLAYFDQLIGQYL